MADQETQHDDLLTPEEQAALDAEEGAEIDGSASLTDEGSQEWQDAGWGAAPAKAEDDAAADDADDDAAAQAAAEPEPEPEPEPEAKRQEPVPDVSQYDSELEKLRAAEKELIDRYDDGDLSREELDAQQAELEEKQAKVIEDRAIARQRIQDETAKWNEAVDGYFKEYAGLRDDKVISAFDTEVRAVTANPAFANRSFHEQLEIAHKRLIAVSDAYGLDVPKLKGAEPEPKPAKQQAADRDVRGDSMRKAPPTLANVPASEVTDSGDSKYAALQRLMDNDNVSPDEKEAALARLSDEERNQFSSMMV